MFSDLFRTRLTPEACLAHEWFKMAEKSDSQKIDNSSLKAFHDRLKEEVSQLLL